MYDGEITIDSITYSGAQLRGGSGGSGFKLVCSKT